MNRRLMFFVGAIALLVIGGGLTSFIAAEGSGNIIPGVLTVTSRPEASVSQFAGSQGLWFLLMVGFILFNLVGASLTGAFLFWFLNREVENAKVMEPANHERIQDAFQLPKRSTTPELPSEIES